MLSAAAGLTFHDLYFRFYEGAIASQQVVEFLQALERHIDRPLLLIWDRLPAHRSWLVQEFLRASQGRIEQVWLPAYAPELNPVEYVWAYWKQHDSEQCVSQGLRGPEPRHGSPHDVRDQIVDFVRRWSARRAPRRAFLSGSASRPASSTPGAGATALLNQRAQRLRES